MGVKKIYYDGRNQLEIRISSNNFIDIELTDLEHGTTNTLSLDRFDIFDLSEELESLGKDLYDIEKKNVLIDEN